MKTEFDVWCDEYLSTCGLNTPSVQPHEYAEAAFKAGKRRNTVIEDVLSNWLKSQDAPEKIMLVRGDTPLSALGMLEELHNGSEIGFEFRDNIIALVIDMVSRETIGGRNGR